MRIFPLLFFATMTLLGMTGPLTAASANDKRDPFVGEWSGECGDGVQCWLQINRDNRGYKTTLFVARWNDSSKILCKVTGLLKRGDPGYIAGVLGESHLAGVFLRSPDRIELHGVADDACKVPYALNGSYTIIGH